MQYLSYEALKSLPKIDLHRHLEGSLRLGTLSEIAREHGLDLPADDEEALRPLVQITDDPPNFQNFLAKFGVLRHFYRSPEAVARLTYEAIVDAATDNVRYLELRFSPQALARVRGFPLEDVTDWVIEATQRASRVCQIEVGLIVTLLRHEDIKLAQRVAQIAIDRHHRGIVGIDLAGDEVNFSSEPFTEIFQEAKRVGLGVTIHAGEWTGADSVYKAVHDLQADRIGHGVSTVEDSRVLKLVKERNIALEVCLTSNAQTGVVHDIAHHPILDLFHSGVAVTLNTDDPCVSNSHLSDEYEVAVDQLGFPYEAIRQMTFNAARAAFLEPAGRERLLKQFQELLPPGNPPTPHFTQNGYSSHNNHTTNYSNYPQYAG